MASIKITQGAQICSGEYRLTTAEGKASAWVLHDWYIAHAVDESGEEYTIIWTLLDSFDPNEDWDEAGACDWEHPIEITRDSDGAEVTDKVQIAW